MQSLIRPPAQVVTLQASRTLVKVSPAPLQPTFSSLFLCLQGAPCIKFRSVLLKCLNKFIKLGNKLIFWGLGQVASDWLRCRRAGDTWSAVAGSSRSHCGARASRLAGAHCNNRADSGGHPESSDAARPCASLSPNFSFNKSRPQHFREHLHVLSIPHMSLVTLAGQGHDCILHH